jgi:hypothetical protein
MIFSLRNSDSFSTIGASSFNTGFSNTSPLQANSTLPSSSSLAVGFNPHVGASSGDRHKAGQLEEA